MFLLFTGRVIHLSPGPILQRRKKNLSLLKRRSDDLKPLLAGAGRAPLGGVSVRAPSHGQESTGPGPALQPARGGHVRPTLVEGGGPSPQTEASGPKAAPQAEGKGPGQETGAGGHGLVLLIAGAGLVLGVEGGARFSAAVPSIDGTGGKGNQATLQFSSCANSVVQGPGRDAAQARLLHGSLNWVRHFDRTRLILVTID